MLTAVVITKNEEDRIKTCLESLKWADELVVIDHGSADSTIGIARQYTNKIFELKDADFDALRNKGIKEAKGQWVLYVDSDERILQPLKEEIQGIARKDQFSAYAISRTNIIFGKKLQFGPYRKDWVIRLFKKDSFEHWVGKIHEYPKFKGELGYCKNQLLHLTHRDVDQIVLKSLEWSKIEAKLRFESGHPKMSGWRFLRILLTETFNQGFKRGGFFNGTIGVMDSLLQVFSMFITYVCLWQLQQPKSPDEIYDEIDKKLVEDNFK